MKSLAEKLLSEIRSAIHINGHAIQMTMNPGDIAAWAARVDKYLADKTNQDAIVDVVIKSK